MKALRTAPAALLLAGALVLIGCGASQRDVLWQTATIGSLVEGVYDGEVTLAELARHGDVGLGTFNALDGEMVVLDGRVYQVRDDGRAYLPDPKATKTPFAAVTFFDSDRSITVDEPWDYPTLRRRIDDALDSLNVPYAVRIDGEFSSLKVRSIPRQQPPYRRLAEAIKHQTVFEHKDVAGTMVGFRLPGYLGGANVAGWHLHFLTADRKAGGHVLAFRVRKARVHLDLTDRFHLALPDTGRFYQADLSGRGGDDVRKAEK